MIEKDVLIKMAAEQDAKAERAYDNYQATGVTRYDRERRKAEDLAEALRAAVNAADNAQLLGHLKANFVWYATLADKALDEAAPREKLAEILEGVVTVAAVSCGYARRERTPKEV